ncbi:hypothetical protein FI178_10165 [Salmonella enterica subsp. enterica]|nr:hypothetical protein [Salmonella enterica subsp. enterica]
MISDKYIELTSGLILDKDTILLSSADGNLEYGAKHAEINIWSADKTKPIFNSTVIKAFVAQIIRYTSKKEYFEGVCILLSAAADSIVFFFQEGKIHKEIIKKLLDEPKAACIHAMSVIDNNIYCCGDNGIVFRRENKNNWIPVDVGIKSTLSAYDVDRKMMDFINHKTKAGQTEPHPIIDWMTKEVYKYTDGRNLYAINGNNQNDIYTCGSVDTPKGKTGILYHYNGVIWTKVNIPETSTLCSIFIDDDGTILIGGYEGHLLESQDGVSFREVSSPNDLMVINEFSKYKDTIYLATSDGLFQYRDKKITRPDIESHISSMDHDILYKELNIDVYGDYILLVGLYSAYRYCFKTKKCELLIKFTGRPDKE